MKSHKRKTGIEKRIGVKYCGGCNPTYDRMQVVRQLKACFLNRFYFLLRSQKNLDGLLFINGCHSSCALEEGGPKGPVYFSISGESELPLLIRWLTTLEERENN